jgi:hypothetical protein
MKQRSFIKNQVVFLKKNGMIIRAVLFTVLFSLISHTSRSQTNTSEIKFSPLPAVSGENIKLFTDRNIYCVNEKIYFTAEYSCINEFASLSWSNVLYVELIKWDGIKLAQMKMNLNRPGTSGSLKIPGNILSGNYYLRAYTKWMRNYSALQYAYMLVKIVNPYRSETDEGPAEKPIPTGAAMLILEQKSLINGVNCTMDKNEYMPGEKAETGLYINNKQLAAFKRYCMSVVRVGTIDTTVQIFKPGSDSLESNLSYIEYLPEIRGITISGEAVDKSTKLPQIDALISLSETQHGEYYSVYQTDDRGRFIFSLPDMHGQHDFFIQVVSKDSMPSELNIDNGFCNRPVKLPYVAFNLNEDEKYIVKDMIINQQLSDRFMSKEDTLSDSQPAKTELLAFYGSKTVVFNTGKYIELPNIEEFINEIVLEATVISEKGKPSYISLIRAGSLYYPPLILMDNIQVNNDDLLLKTPLSKIKKIEIINADYAVGGIKYTGIISIYSRDKDFAGVALNKNSMFFTYDLFSNTDPGYDNSKKTSDPRIPDRRNLLYWNPDIQLSPGKKMIISFYTSDTKGDYIVYIRGKNSNDNREIYGRCYFSVK